MTDALGQYGAPRMQPHRGAMVRALGGVSVALGALDLCCGCAFVLPLAFGLVAWGLGASDLRAMAAGTMDPAGREQTNAGRILGIIGACLGLAAVVGWTLLLAFSGPDEAYRAFWHGVREGWERGR